MTDDPRHAAADLVAAMTDAEFSEFARTARDPYQRHQAAMASVTDQLRQAIAGTDHNGRTATTNDEE